MNNLDFSRELLKGKIAEIIFEQMFSQTKKFFVQKFGYEYITPELSQNQYDLPKEILADIRHNPDFILLDKQHGGVYLIEVKYRSKKENNIYFSEECQNISKHLVNRWHSPFLFVASLDGFYFDPCNSILNNKDIKKLDETWVSFDIQNEYLGLLKEFESNHK